MAQAFGKAVIIGLGGSGQAALIRIKKMFLDHCNGALPPCIRLLAFDTSSRQEHVFNAKNEKITFDSEEFYHLRVGTIRSVIENNQYVKQWWINYPPIDDLSVTEGTGGIRQVGRLAVFVNIDTIARMLERSFNAVNNFEIETKMKERGMELLDITPQVFVIGSFAGGTGSGSFFDFSILCRSIGGQGIFYSAVFMMPWIYRNLQKAAYENGYASLLELEQLNSSTSRNPYLVQYSSGLEFTLKERPYHIVNLVDGKCRNNYRIQNHYELSQFIGECIFNSVGAIGETAADVTNNIMTMMNRTTLSDWENRRASYSAFGVSSIVYPGQEIHERFSLHYAIEMIDLVCKYIDVSMDLPLEEVAAEIEPFMAKHGISPDQNGIVKKILPEGSLPAYALDTDINLRDPELRREVQNDLDRWEKEQRKKCTDILMKKSIAIKSDINKAIDELLFRIKEAEKTGSLPKSSYEAANTRLLKYWMVGQKNLTEEKEKQIKIRDGLRDELEACLSAFPQRKLSFPFSTNPARTAYSNYADVREKLLQCDVLILCIEKSLELYGDWEKKAEGIGKELKGTDIEKRSAQTRMVNLKSEFITRRSLLFSERLRKRKSPFEIYVGDMTEDKTDVVYYMEKYKLPKASDDFDSFRAAHTITDRNSFNEIRDDSLRDMFMNYAREKTSSLQKVTVLDVLHEIEKKNPGFIAETVEQARKNATLLLPIDNDKVSAREHLLSEFTVVGGENKETLAESLGQFMPSSVVQNLWVSTGDRNRITICTFFAAIPLYALKDIKELRSKYLERVYPPSHTNKEFEFDVPDALPETYLENKTLKLLSLAMLNTVNLITRVQRRDGTKFYRMSPKVMGNDDFIDDEDLQLPGKPGKFYSLYEEVCKNNALQEKLENALLELEKEEGFCDRLVKSMEARLKEFRDVLDVKYVIYDEKNQPFNKMITGNLYQRQVDFFTKALKERVRSVKEMLG